MVESNERAGHRDGVTKEAPMRSRRRRTARWKSGLILTGLGTVVLGAGYLAGVNAPAVDASGSSGAIASAGTIAQSGAARSDALGAGANQNQLVVPRNSSSEDGQVFQFNGDDDFGEDNGRFFGNQALPGDNGIFLFNGGSGSGSSSQPNPQFGQQSGGRRNRQFGSFGQQQPNFGGPVTRSRGS